MTPADKAAIGDVAMRLARSTPGSESAFFLAREGRRLLGAPKRLDDADTVGLYEHAIRAAFDAGAESVSKATVDPPSEDT